MSDVVDVGVIPEPVSLLSAWERVWDYFSRPGAELSFEEDGDCFYRHPDDGRMCAAGVFIPDEVYNVSMEGVGCRDVFYNCGWSGVLVEFVNELQNAHDSSVDLLSFRRKLAELKPLDPNLETR